MVRKRLEPNLKGRVGMIEILTLLDVKTKGNLTAEERQVLEQVLYGAASLRARRQAANDAVVTPPGRATPRTRLMPATAADPRGARVEHAASQDGRLQSPEFDPLDFGFGDAALSVSSRLTAAQAAVVVPTCKAGWCARHDQLVTSIVLVAAPPSP